jgi:hypothetical protein
MFECKLIPNSSENRIYRSTFYDNPSYETINRIASKKYGGEEKIEKQ